MPKLKLKNIFRRRHYGHGWKKDRFKPCAIHTITAAIPDITILDQYLPDIQDQGNEGSCVGQGESELLVACAKIASVYTGKFSARWIYNGARFIEGTLASDAGCYPSDAWDWLLNKGGLLDIIWPYIAQSDINTPPPSKYDPEAAKYPLLKVVRVVGGVDGICSAISEGHFVGVGCPWFIKWENPGSDGKLAEVTASDKVADGHFTIFYGYDRIQQIFYCQNSWGPDWGNGGRFTMPFSAFDVFPQFGGWDGWYVTVDWGTQPPPVPAPVINSFTATPATINQGDSSILAWDVSGADTVDIDQAAAPASGSVTLSPVDTTTYTLTATNAAGSVTASVTVTVIIPTPPPPPTPTPQLRVRLQGTIDGGLSWSTLFDIGFGILSRMVRRKKVKSE